jgi:FkbM family methyltransferase
MFIPHLTDVSPEKRDIFDRLLTGGRKAKYILGRNKYAESVAAAISPTAFVDDYTDEKEFLGRPVIRMDQLPQDCIVVSCVVDAHPLTALERLRRAGVRESIDYFTLARLAPESFQPVAHSAFNRQDILGNQAKYQWLHQRLADQTSRQTFEQVTQFRLTWDLDWMAGFSVDVDRQYFEDFVPLGVNEVFVDGGGYDGETTKRFASLCPGYRQIYYFEPNPSMLELSQRTLGALRSISFIPKGLFSRSSVARFDPSAGSASRISSQGSLEISLVSLDDAVSEAVTFVKLDLEGAECEALEGAREHIRKEHPKLAVSVYHDQRDFWRVPETVLQIYDAYDVYVRHYTEGPLETVMYFIPSDG